jgi:heme oxygenase
MIMQRLRDETAALHAHVEAMLNPAVRFSSRSEYAELLRILHPFYRKCEVVLAALPWQEIGFDFDARRKDHLLIADLQALGEPSVDERPDAYCPICIDLASGFGTLYVLEGATLGGRILRKQLRSKLGIDATNGGSFYDCYADRTNERWTEFKAAAESYVGAQPHRIDSTLAAATATFTAIGRLLAPAAEPSG